MRTVAIVAEYNPFHNGHLYQIKKVKEHLGDDCAIVAIMSGNFTQRGELAIADKTVRAKSAVMAGVDLVLELPFPYSMSSAEFFASAGVQIATKLGVIDYLAFGSESGDINELYNAAKVISSEEFLKRTLELSSLDGYSSMGYPKICQSVYEEIVGSHAENLFTPNNILALEYIKAIIRSSSNLVPMTIKRAGASYNSESIIHGDLQSATAIRDLFYNNISAADFVPESTLSVLFEAKKNGMFPIDQSRLDLALISDLRLNSSVNRNNIHDCAGGLYNRLQSASFEATDIQDLIKITETKKYTRARIRRAVWYGYLGVTSSDVRTPVAYTQVLAMNAVGRKLLKKIKKMSDFPVITKPSSYENFGDAVVCQKKLSDKADSVFALAHKVPISGKFSLTFTPFVKE